MGRRVLEIKEVGKRKRGRLSRRYIDCIKEDLVEKGLEERNRSKCRRHSRSSDLIIMKDGKNCRRRTTATKRRN